MGIILSNFLFGYDVNTEQRKKSIKDKDIKVSNNQDNKGVIKSINFISIYKIGNKFIRYIEQFPNGNLLITTNEGIIISDKNFNILSEVETKTNNICIKNDKIFASYDNKFLIDIWSYENNIITHIFQIKYDGRNEINHIELLNNNDLVGLSSDTIFFYKANLIKPNKYIYSKILILKYKSWIRNFIITKDEKHLIIQHENNIEFYLIKTFEKIGYYKYDSLPGYENCTKLYIIDDHSFALQLAHSPMTIMEPPDILIIIDFKDLNNIKQLGIIRLNEYDPGCITKDKIFLFVNYFTRAISVYDNVLKNEFNESKKTQESIKLCKRYYFNKYSTKIIVLSDNRLCVYCNSTIDVYLIKND